ncbi:MAG: ABC-F family ATP-binding cassette domain-containing protein [Anaerolineae bacterium]|nr:ABC-F family ATP-binding cassette domain-containing protein [Anaerolineae bacterium]
MSLLTTTNLAKSFGADDIFDGINVEVPYGARIAMVGPNGAGKTTLLNILVGLDVPTEGSFTIARNTRIGFLPQRPELVGDHSLWEEALSAFSDLRRMEAQLNELEQAMADPDQHDAALAKYGPLQERFELAGGYTYDQRMKMVLQGLGFDPEEDFNRSLVILSGGQKTRALLARLLLEEPDLLVMDEPTNHLDIQAVEWLENYLKGFPGAVLSVSHDRYFMDHYAQIVWELDYGTIETYRGHYSHYVRQREERRERLWKEWESQQEFVSKEEAYIRKHMGSRMTSQAKGKLKRLETMRKRGKLIDRPRHKKRSMHLNISRVMRSGDQVLRTRNLAVGYPDDPAPLFDVPDITLYRGQVAALIGPNGVGKSTFLKTIIGQLEPLRGEVKIGASVDIGYFAQAHERLHDDQTILDEIIATKHMPVSEARSYLGSYLFSGDDVFRPISTLSGGERGRVALAKLALSGANFLLLDEPTNHLDIDSQEVLQAVLDDFPGTILLVSHDRYLIDALATQIWAAAPGSLDVFEGTYAEYIGKTQPQAEVESSHKVVTNGRDKAAPASGKKHGLNPYELNRRVSELEARIHDLEAQMDSLTADLEKASARGDSDRVHALGIAYTRTEDDLEQALEEWGRLAE